MTFSEESSSTCSHNHLFMIHILYESLCFDELIEKFNFTFTMPMNAHYADQNRV